VVGKSDGTRPKVKELDMPLSTGQLADRVGLSPSTVSYHLQALLRVDLVKRVRPSRIVYYQR
jgi:DNA-binding transcriptional ArsR family regulator